MSVKYDVEKDMYAFDDADAGDVAVVQLNETMRLRQTLQQIANDFTRLVEALTRPTMIMKGTLP